MKENIVADKSFSFAVQIVRLCNGLIIEKKEYVLSRQLLRSGTSIGAIIREAIHAESPADFIHKLSMALKEANETEYWIMLIEEGGYVPRNDLTGIRKNCDELIRLLVQIIKTLKAKK